eukprot:g1211.t1
MALESLATIPYGGISASAEWVKTNVNPKRLGYKWTVTFHNNHGNVPELVCTTTALTSNGGGAATGRGCEVNTVTQGSMLSGTFKLKDALYASATHGTTHYITADIPSTATASQMQTYLQNVATPGTDDTTLVELDSAGLPPLEASISKGGKTHGAVTVTRTAYPPISATGVVPKWNGGWKWEIEWTNRVGNVGDLNPASSLTTTGTNPTVTVTPMVDGNEIDGKTAAANKHFKLKYGGTTSQQFYSDFSSAAFKSRFETDFLAGADRVMVSRRGPTKARGYHWLVTFTHAEVGGDQAPVELSASTLAGSGVAVACGEQFGDGKGNQLGGSFQLKFRGFESVPIAFNAADTVVQSAINNIETIRPSRVRVTRTDIVTHPTLKDGSQQVKGYRWTVTFLSGSWSDPTAHDARTYISNNWQGPPADWADSWTDTGFSKEWGKNVGDVPAIECLGNGLTVSNAIASGSQSCVVEEAIKGVDPLGGSFSLRLDTGTGSGCSDDDSTSPPGVCRVGYKGVETTGLIAHNAPATRAESGGDGSSLQEKLEALKNVGEVDVSRSAVTTTTGGFIWSVTFKHDDAATCEAKDTEFGKCNSPGDIPTLTQFDKHYCMCSNGVPAVAPTPKLSWDATAQQVKAHLEVLKLGRKVEVSRKVLNSYGAMEWLVRFTANPGHTPPGAGDVDTLVVTSTLLTPSPTPTVEPVVETQKGSDSLQGDITLSFGSESCTASFEETARRLELKLDELTSIGDVNVARSMYPSDKEGGWGAVAVDTDGTHIEVSRSGEGVSKTEQQIISVTASSTVSAKDHATMQGYYRMRFKHNRASQAVSACDRNTERLTVQGHGFAEGAEVFLSGGFASAEANLHPDRPFFIHVVDADTFTLHLTSRKAVTNANAVDISSSFAAAAQTTETSCLKWGASAAELEVAIGQLGIQLKPQNSNTAGSVELGEDSVQVTRSGTGDSHSSWGYTYTIRFVGGNVRGDIPLLGSSTTGCTGVAPGSQIVIATGSGSEGSQAIKELTLETPYAGSAVGIRAAYLVAPTFRVMAPLREVQQIIVKDTTANPTHTFGTQKYVLRFTHGTPSPSQTIALDWNAPEAQVEAALNALANVQTSMLADAACSNFHLTGYGPELDGLATAADACRRPIQVTRSTDAALAPKGYVYNVYFEGSAVSGDITMLEVLDSTASGAWSCADPGGTCSITVSPAVEGTAPPLDPRTKAGDARLLTATTLPLASVGDLTAKTAARAIGGSVTASAALPLYKVNGHLWSIAMDSYLGDMPAMAADASGLIGDNSAVTVVDNVVRGTLPRAMAIPQLATGIPYFTRVAAANSVGMGPVSSVESGVPIAAPVAVGELAAGHAIHVDEVQTVTAAATHIDEVQMITTSARSAPEVQMITTTAQEYHAIAGKFALRFPEIRTISLTASSEITSGQITVSGFKRVSTAEANLGTATLTEVTVGSFSVAWNAPAVTMASALDTALGTVGSVQVTRSGDGTANSDFGYVWSITFVVLNTDKTLGTATEIQTLTVSADKAINVGNYKLAFDHGGVKPTTAACIEWNAEASEMESKLEALANVDSVRVLRSGSGGQTDSFGYTYTIFFDGNAVRGDVSLLEVDHTGCKAFQTLENNILTATGVNGLVTPKVVDNGGISPNFIAGGTSAATLAHLTAELTQIPEVVNVVTTRSLADREGGYSWTVAMTSSNDADLDQMVCDTDAAFKTVAGSSCVVSTLADGNVIGGTFVLSGSPPIAYDAPAVGTGSVKEALEALNDVGTVQVTRSGPDEQRGYTWMVTFITDVGDIAALVPVSSLYGTAANVAIREHTKGNQIAGSFTLSYNGESTAALAYNAPAIGTGSMKAALEALSAVGRVDVSRSMVDTERGYTWSVTFRDTMNDGDVPMLHANDHGLTAVGKVVQVREMTKGSPATSSHLWVSFQPPANNNGGAISKYTVQWDTASTFTTSNVQAYDFYDHAYLYEEQKISLSAPTLTTTSAKISLQKEVQTVTIAGAAGTKFSLSFRGMTSPQFEVGLTKLTGDATSVQTVLSGMGTVGKVTVSIAASVKCASCVTATNADLLQWTVNADLTTTLFAGEKILVSGCTSEMTVQTVTWASPAGVVTVQAGHGCTGVNAPATASITCSACNTLITGLAMDITFDEALGAVPLLASTGADGVVVKTAGATPYRKAVQAFKCTGDAGKFSVTHTVGASVSSQDVLLASENTVAAFKVKLEGLASISSPGGVTVWTSSGGTVLCKATSPDIIYVRFDRQHGTDAGALTFDATALTVPGPAAGAIQLMPAESVTSITTTTGSMSGAFSLEFGGHTTGLLNVAVSTVGLRDALEALPSVTTADVLAREESRRMLSGSLDVVKGQMHATCAAASSCNFAGASHGVPGDLISIGGSWYRVFASTDNLALPSDKLYLADTNNNPVGYLGDTMSGVVAYEWGKGYEWTVLLQRITVPAQQITAPVHNIHPTSAVVHITGRTCSKCYYLPAGTNAKLTANVNYYIRVHSHNSKGATMSNTISAVPKTIPGMPTELTLMVVSGSELEVFFAPPALPVDTVAAGFTDDTTSYTVQWDTSADFRYGTTSCESCAKSLTGAGLTVLTVDANLITGINKLLSGYKIVVDGCSSMEVVAVAATTVTVKSGHTCPGFSGASRSIKLYRAREATLTGLQIRGTPPFKYVIQGLTAGTEYFVRVAARNSVAVQPVDPTGDPADNTNWANAGSQTPQHQKPSAPVAVRLSVQSGTSLMVTIQVPLRDGEGTGGAAITHYHVEWSPNSDFSAASSQTHAVGSALLHDLDMRAGHPQLGTNKACYIPSLSSGTPYYVRVSAKNTVGYSPTTAAKSPLAPIKSPAPPTSVTLSTIVHKDSRPEGVFGPITHLTTNWSPPATNGGGPIVKYKVEWWTQKRVDEVQVVTLKWATSPTTGKWIIKYKGDETVPMAKDISALNLRAALMNIGAGVSLKLGAVSVTRTALETNKGFSWSVTFHGAANLNAGNIPELIAVNNAMDNNPELSVVQLVPGQRDLALFSTPTVSGNPEVQLITTATATSTVSGWWRARYKRSEYTNYLPIDVTADDLRDALEGLTTVGQVQVAKSTASNSQNSGAQWTVKFITNVGDLEPLELDVTKLRPASATHPPLSVFDGNNAVQGVGSYATKDYDSRGLPVCTSCIIGEPPVEYGFYETVDASVGVYQIPQLTPGTVYSVAVTAMNSRGYGERLFATPTTMAPPQQTPGKPINVAIDVEYGDFQRLKLTYRPPISDGGSAITKYRVEWDTSTYFPNPGVEEFICPNSPKRAEWTVTTSAASGVITGGHFRLRLQRGGLQYLTDEIAFNALAKATDEVGGLTGSCTVMCVATELADPNCSPARIRTSGSVELKLEALDAIDDVIVTRTGPDTYGGYSWTVTFNEDKDDFALSVDTSSVALTGTGPLTGAAVVPRKVISQACRGQAECGMAVSSCAGCTYTSCTGTRAVPTTGGLIKGQLYYMRVFAYNAVGYSDPQVVKTPQKPMVIPSAPTGVTMEVYSSYQLKILFSPPTDLGGDLVLTYMIEWDTNSSFTNSTGDYDSFVKQLTETTMTGTQQKRLGSLQKPLKIGVDYYVRVKAANSQGYGPSVRSSPTYLNPSKVPEVPTNAQLFVTDDTLLTVTWETPADTASGDPGDGGDPIIGYQIQWDKTPTFDSLNLFPNKGTIQVAASERAYTIGADADGDGPIKGQLETAQTYYVRVAAVNLRGVGDAAKPAPQFASPSLQLPGKVVSVAAAAGAAGELVVSWARPALPHHGFPCYGSPAAPTACPDISNDHPTNAVQVPGTIGGAYVRRYVVGYRKSTVAAWTTVDASDVTALNNLRHTLTGLDSAEQYDVRVSACNVVGCGAVCAQAGAACGGAAVQATTA